MAAWKARGGIGEAGRNLGVRPVPEPELSRIFVDGTGELSSGGRVAEGDGRAATVSVGEKLALLRALTVTWNGKTCYERLAMEREAKTREGGTWGRR